MKIDNTLWQFAKEFYASTGVWDELLTLQNSWGYNVIQLIFATWLASNHLRLTRLVDVASGSKEWRQDVTSPLRQIRKLTRQLMSKNVDLQSHIGSCYQALLGAELAAEQVELEMMYTEYASAAKPAAVGVDLHSLIIGNFDFCRQAHITAGSAIDEAEQSVWNNLEKLAVGFLNN